jgi:hypothetical protein
MKKTFIVLFGLFAVIFVLWTIPTTRNELLWYWVSYKNEMNGYETYISIFPQGQHTVEASSRLDEFAWKNAKKTNTVEGFDDYVLHYPKGKYVAEASQLTFKLQEEQAWIDAVGDPKGNRHILRERYKHLREQLAIDLKEFLAKYPSSNHADEARGMLLASDVDLIASGFILTRGWNSDFKNTTVIFDNDILVQEEAEFELNTWKSVAITMYFLKDSPVLFERSLLETLLSGEVKVIVKENDQKVMILFFDLDGFTANKLSSKNSSFAKVGNILYEFSPNDAKWHVASNQNDQEKIFATQLSNAVKSR